MIELAAVLGAFFLYLVGLPLVGMLGFLCCRALLPYLLGSGIVYGLLSTLFAGLTSSLLLLLAIALWSVPALCVRYWPSLKGKSMSWHQGHYRASLVVATLGLCARRQQDIGGAYPLAAGSAKLKAG